MKMHPGGSIILEKWSVNSGKDATEAFHTFHQHSSNAKEKMKQFLIKK